MENIILGGSEAKAFILPSFGSDIIETKKSISDIIDNDDFHTLQEILECELGTFNNLGENFIHSLKQEIISKSTGNYTDTMKIVGDIYFEIGKSWGPIIKHWGEWIKKNAPGGNIKLAMRDGKILKEVFDKNEYGEIWLNRPLLGIGDELSGENGGNLQDTETLKKYFEQNGLFDEFYFIDTGCWGTVILEIYKTIKSNGKHSFMKPLYFYSHNPYIPGFVNELGVSSKVGEILNDSLECCFLNSEKRPTKFKNSGGIILPDIEDMDNKFIYEISKKALEGILEGSKEKISLNDAVNNLLTLVNETKKGKFTGLLPFNSPTWSEGSDFIKNWPEELNWTQYQGEKKPL